MASPQVGKITGVQSLRSPYQTQQERNYAFVGFFCFLYFILSGPRLWVDNVDVVGDSLAPSLIIWKDTQHNPEEGFSKLVCTF